MACGQEQGLISVDDALQLLLNTVKPLSSIERAPQQALGQFLAQPVFAQVDLPPFRQSAVDGYALCAEPPFLANQDYRLLPEIRAGQTQNTTLSAGQAQRIFTGAEVPQGCVTVARQEYVQSLSSTAIRLTQNIDINADTRDQGEEIAQGQLLAETGQKLHVGAIAALCMAGVQKVAVYAQPRVAVVITGDEIAVQAKQAQGAIIFDANGPMLQTWLQQMGISAKTYHVADDPQQLEQCFAQLKTTVDVILTTGGVSVGDYDYVRPCAFAQNFQQVFWKVKQKPGKPLFFAHYQHQQQQCYLLGLPGNPAAVYVGLHVYAQSLINALQGQTHALQWFEATLQHDLKADSRERFLRMYARVTNSQMTLTALQKQQSHMLSNLLQANCLVRIPAHASVKTGDQFMALWLNE